MTDGGGLRGTGEAACEDCLLCHRRQPSGHVVVRRDGQRVGRVCASHRLWEVIRAEFLVTVEDCRG